MLPFTLVDLTALLNVCGPSGKVETALKPYAEYISKVETAQLSV